MKTLKKLGCISVIICAWIASVHAQEIRFGAKAGLNLASYIGDETDLISNRTAFHIGGVAEIPIPAVQNLFFSPEILYSSQGSKESYSGFEDTYKMDYLNIPLTVSYYAAENLSFSAGPQLGILLSAKVAYKETYDDVKYSGTVDIREFYSDLDFGLNIGAGYRLTNGVFFQGRYNIGLTNVHDSAFNMKQQNSVFQISAGYILK